MQVIRRIAEGAPLPDFHSVRQILATEEEPTGAGTNTRTVYTLLLSDDRYWMSDEQKLAGPSAAERVSAVREHKEPDRRVYRRCAHFEATMRCEVCHLPLASALSGVAAGEHKEPA